MTIQLSGTETRLDINARARKVRSHVAHTANTDSLEGLIEGKRDLGVLQLARDVLRAREYIQLTPENLETVYEFMKAVNEK